MKSTRKLVNRRDPNYHPMRRSEINSADKIASYLLALNYSGRTSQTQVSQGLIQMDCVAVAYINGEYLVASNSRKISDENMLALADELGFSITYALINRGQGNMHAEMQVMEEIRASGYSFNGVYIGVSKPCCLYCKAVLDNYRVGYVHYHESSVANWEEPDLR